jgi:hypothetical protein
MKSSKRGAGTLMPAGLEACLAENTKSRLQGIFMFWHPGAKVPSSGPTLMKKLAAVLADTDAVYERFSRMSESQQNFLLTLAGFPDFAAGLSEVLKAAPASRIPNYERDTVIKVLTTSGILSSAPAGDWSRNGREVYFMPKEVGDIIRSFKALADGPAAELSLRRFLLGFTPSERARAAGIFTGLDGESDADELTRRLSRAKAASRRMKRIREKGLSAAVRDAVIEKGGIVFLSGNGEGLPITDNHALKVAWRHELESLFLGTIGNVDFESCGVEFKGEVMAVFGEIVEEVLLAHEVDPDRIDEIFSAEGDVLVELDRLIAYIKGHRLSFSVDGSFYKDDAKNLAADSFLLKKMGASGQELVAYLVGLLEAAGVADVHDEVVLTPAAGKWDGKPLVEKLKKLLEVTRKQTNPHGSDFHQRQLRGRVLSFLERLEPGKWYHPRILVTLAVMDYLAGLEENGIGEKFKSYKFKRHKPGYHLRNRCRDLSGDLFWWVRHRLFPLGIIDFALSGGNCSAMRISPLGARVLGKTPCGDECGRILIVNPDYEIMLFPEGDYYETFIRIASFAVLEKRDQVAHFRITEDSIKRAIFSGQRPENIVGLLETHSKNPLPQNVRFSVLDWEKSVSYVSVSRPVLLETEDEAAMRKVRSLPLIEKVIERELSPTAVLLKERPNHKRLVKELKNIGVYLR